jgi:hypothetical protein
MAGSFIDLNFAGFCVFYASGSIHSRYKVAMAAKCGGV